MKKSGSVVWRGGHKDGVGAISTESGALKSHPCGFVARFEDGPGVNPEELIGAAHAGCFIMALSKILGDANLTASQLNAKADVTLEKVATAFPLPPFISPYAATFRVRKTRHSSNSPTRQKSAARFPNR